MTVKSVLLIALLSFTSQWALAVESKGMAEVKYSGWLDKDEIREAEKQAQAAAVASWIATEQASQYANYEKVKGDIDQRISDYILSYDVIDSEQDKDKKTYRVVIRAVLNQPMLESKLLSSSAIATQGEQAYVTFVFVAREVAGVQSKSEESETLRKAQGQGIGKDIGESQSSTYKEQEQTIGKGSEKTVYTDNVVWRVSTANEVDVAMGDVFTNANYLVIDAALLEEETDFLLRVDDFIDDYKSGNDLKSDTKRNALKGLRDLEDPVHYMAIGTLDVDASQVDDKTGNILVPVSVTGQVLAIQKRGAAVAKVGPVQYFGTGPSQLVAKNNALKLAAQEAAKDLVAKLSGKNIR